MFLLAPNGSILSDMHPRSEQSRPALPRIPRRTRIDGNEATDLEAQGGEHSTGDDSHTEDVVSTWFFQRWEKRQYEASTYILFVLHIVRLIYDFYPRSAA